MKVMLLVPHAGQNKYVGKCFTREARGKREIVFLHEESGNQRHRDFDCPGGLDRDVVTWLWEQGCSRVVHYDRQTRLRYETDPDTLRRFGIPATYAKRNRIYLPERFWTIERGPLAGVPWCATEVVIGAAEIPAAQASLFGD